MATDLRIVELAEVCDFQGGAAFKPEFQGMASGDLPFIKVSDMNLAGNEVSITTANNWVTSETARQMGAKPAPPGSVVFAKIGEALRQNRLRQLLRATIVDNNMMAAVPKLGAIDPRFFYYALSQIDFNTIAQGTALPYLTMSVLARQRLAIPPLPEQRRIARILGTLDDKIELNRHMNETLEEMARALFTSWFVDFDPVRAKAEGRDPGLPPHLADLFPDRLVDSELGEIPEGWEIEALGMHFEAVRGVSYSGSGLGEVGVPLHNLNSVFEGGGYKHAGIKYYTGGWAERHRVGPGDVIVANTEQGHERLLIGHAAIVPPAFGDLGIASHHIFVMRPKPASALTREFLCDLLNSRQMHDTVSRYANGTTVNMLPVDGLQMPRFAPPPVGVCAVFTDLRGRFAERQENVVLESSALIALRDALLPRLISGRIRTPVPGHQEAASTSSGS